MRKRDDVCPLGAPLGFFAVPPEKEDRGEEAGYEHGEPGAVGEFGDGGGKVEAFEGGEDEEAEEDEEDVETPDDEGCDGDHAGCYEGDQNDAGAIGVAEFAGLSMSEIYAFLRILGKDIVIDCSNNDCPHHKHPIRGRNVNLSKELLGRVLELQLRKVICRHDLREQLERCRNHSLRSHNRRQLHLISPVPTSINTNSQ